MNTNIAGTAESGIKEKLICGNMEGKYQLALVFKRVYRINDKGQCVLTEERPPLFNDIVVADEDLPLPFAHWLKWDSDLWPFKPATDVVVQGKAYNHSNRGFIDTKFEWGSTSRTVRVYGDRHVDRIAGNWVISEPKPFDVIPLTYNRAYGEWT